MTIGTTVEAWEWVGLALVASLLDVPASTMLAEMRARRVRIRTDEGVQVARRGQLARAVGELRGDVSARVVNATPRHTSEAAERLAAAFAKAGPQPAGEMTVAEVCEALGLHHTRVLELIRDERLPAWRKPGVSGPWTVSAAAVRALAAVRPRPEPPAPVEVTPPTPPRPKRKTRPEPPAVKRKPSPAPKPKPSPAPTPTPATEPPAPRVRRTPSTAPSPASATREPPAPTMRHPGQSFWHPSMAPRPLREVPTGKTATASVAERWGVPVAELRRVAGAGVGEWLNVCELDALHARLVAARGEVLRRELAARWQVTDALLGSELRRLDLPSRSGGGEVWVQPEHLEAARALDPLRALGRGELLTEAEAASRLGRSPMSVRLAVMSVSGGALVRVGNRHYVPVTLLPKLRRAWG